MRPLFTSDMAPKWFGYDVPKHVTVIEIYRDNEYFEMRVRWKVRGDDAVHTMPFEQTDQAVQAVFAAMKLTC